MADVNSQSMITRNDCSHESCPPLNTRMRMMYENDSSENYVNLNLAERPSTGLFLIRHSEQ